MSLLQLIKDKREQRNKIVADSRKLIDKAGEEKRSMTAEENASFDKAMTDVDKLGEEIARLEKQSDAERSLAESQGRKTDPNPVGDPDPANKPGGAPVDRRATPEYRSMFAQFLTGGWNAFGPAEQRALQADKDVSGGYLIAPLQMVSELIKAVDNLVFVRLLANKISVTGADGIGAPTLDADPADADWTTELATGSEDSTMAVGKRELHPHPLAKRIKVSQKLLSMAAGAEALVMNRLAYKFAVSQEKAFLTGSGAGQPLGVFTASASGISTSRDVSTDNTATSITGDGLINAKYSLKSQYHSRAVWLFHRDAVKQIRKLKNGDGVYLWQPGLAGAPDTILDRPFYMSEYVPNTFTTGLYVGLFGDFSQYWIADRNQMSVQRLNELYAETNQVGFIGRWESDGAPAIEEAFARIKLG